MKEDAATLIHGVIIDPIEDSTSDNLHGLAELVYLCNQERLETSLGVKWTQSAKPNASATKCLILSLEASGDLQAVAPVARRAAELEIYPDVEVGNAGAVSGARQLLHATVGVTVTFDEQTRRKTKDTKVGRDGYDGHRGQETSR